MKKLYFLLLMLSTVSLSFGQTTLYEESFETNTNGTNYFTSIAEFTDSSVSTGYDFFLRTDGSDIGANYSVTGTDGSFFFGAQDIDGEGATLPVNLTTAAIDVTGLSDVDFVILLAEDDDAANQDWDSADFVNITYSIDSGADQNLIWVRSEGATNTVPRIDTDFDGTGDGAEITSTFTEYSANIPLSGASSITFKIEFSLNSGDEDIAIDNIRVINGFVAAPTITISAPSDGTTFAPGTTSVNVEWTTANTGGTETVDITVNGSTTNGVSSPFAVATTDGQTYNITVELVDGGVLDSDTVSFSVGNLTTVADITALRADVTANGVGLFYEITGASLLTHTDGFQNRKWFQDSNISGVLVYDSAGTIATTYAIGDNVTGLKGYTEEANGVLRFVPTEDSGVIASSGNPVVPQTVAIADFNAAPDDYESELIEFQNVTFVEGDGVATFATGTNYNVTDGVNTAIKRTDFFSADYIGTVIPSTQLSSLVGVAGEFNGTSQIYVRNLSDFTLGLDNYNMAKFSIYPNPTSTGYVTINTTSSAAINAKVFDILGKQVLESNVTNNQLSVSGLNTGVYILKLTQDNATTTKKLVIK